MVVVGWLRFWLVAILGAGVWLGVAVAGGGADDGGMRVLPRIVVWLAMAGLVAQEPVVVPVDFAKQVAPILVERCLECHGAKEHKGDLRLHLRAELFPEGRESEWLVVPGKPEASELVRRIGLPASDEEVMPNKGQPLTKAQQDVLVQWVAAGAVWPGDGDAAVAALVAAQALPVVTFELPAVDAAAQAAIDAAVVALRQKGAVVQPVAAGSQALEANLSLLRSAFGDGDAALLVPLAPVLVWLNASRTALTEAAAGQVAQLRQLRRLQLANTAWGDAGCAALAALPHLETLNVYGTKLTDQGLTALAAAPALRRVYAWQTGAGPAGAAALQQGRPGCEVDLGDYAEARLAAAQREITEREARNRPANSQCPVLDKPVDAAIVVEFEGRRIAFCCNKCKAAFEKEPKKYLAKLPPVEAGGPPKAEPAGKVEEGKQGEGKQGDGK